RPAPPMRTLIVEDDAPYGGLLRRALAAEGYASDHAADGEEALSLLQVVRYDLVLLDVMLPLASGLEVCSRLRAARQDVTMLMLRPERVFTRDEISVHVWDFDYEGASNLIDVYVGRLRRKLGPAARCLVTLRGQGYSLRP